MDCLILCEDLGTERLHQSVHDVTFVLCEHQGRWGSNGLLPTISSAASDASSSRLSQGSVSSAKPAPPPPAAAASAAQAAAPPAASHAVHAEVPKLSKAFRKNMR